MFFSIFVALNKPKMKAMQHGKPRNCQMVSLFDFFGCIFVLIADFAYNCCFANRNDLKNNWDKYNGRKNPAIMIHKVS